MTNKQALDWAMSLLEANNISTARLDSLVLLEDNTGLDRAQILTYPDKEITPSNLTEFKKQIRQRTKHYPLAYIRGKTEFYARDFIVNHHVLEPRPESEAIIEEATSIIKQYSEIISVIDVGTGSGALIINLKLENPTINAYATDNSKSSIKVALKNAKLHETNINFFEGNLINPIPKQTWNSKAVIVANLPYVPQDWYINPPAMREPKRAIYGGKDGLTVYRRFFIQIRELDRKPSWILTESMPPQHKKLTALARSAGYGLVKTNDFIQIFKA